MSVYRLADRMPSCSDQALARPVWRASIVFAREMSWRRYETIKCFDKAKKNESCLKTS
jgi:hypothetical protein